MFGRDEIEWEELTRAGERFLIERAQLEKTTTYTELNAVLARRTGLRPFDFDQQSERAAVGHLLGLIVERGYPETGLMLSALVQYLDANDAGPGFYALAQDLNLLGRRATSDAKLTFWLTQVRRVHDHYAGHPAP
jgi:hypothetical protein